MKIYVIIISFFLSSCAEKFSSNDLLISKSIPSVWNHPFPDTSKVIGNWWESFQDTSLNKILSDFDKNSPDLKTVASRLKIAKQVLRINNAVRLPSASFSLNGSSRQQNLTAFGLSGDFFGGGQDSSQSNTDNSGVTSFASNNFGMNLSMQWELDLWGKVFNRSKAAFKDYESISYDLSFLNFSLRVQLAKLYFSTLEASKQFDLSKETFDSVNELASMVSARYDKGLRSSLDVRLTQSSVSSSRATMETRKQIYVNLVRRLESMLGKYPSGTYKIINDISSDLPIINSGLPSAILTRRPDIKSALSKVEAASHRKSESFSSFLPSFILTSSLGTSSSELSDILNDDYQVWSQGLAIGLPVFQGGSVRANKIIAQENLEIAKQDLIKVILNAFSEVEQTLFAENSNDVLLYSYTDAAEQAEAAYKLSRERYDSGLVSLIAVMDSQQRWFLARSQVLTAKKSKIDTRLNLLLAFGGNF